ncbi:DUF3047 domain-containing protein [Mangrovitalea sediminis]|uniref:DUF3047 domain-containing protein n=1 Tax=Mangrovitalea sediminis TaxID=1982043 RepID=UPI000BE52A9C|nr:DUF3047 domain-containing protein [Mangrovitalea sediminis]
MPPPADSRYRRRWLAGALFLCVVVSAWAAENRPTSFSQLTTLNGSGWQPLHFPHIDRHTTYRLVTDHGQQVVEAHTQDSASGLIYPLRLEPGRHVLIHWRWKISNTFARGDARHRDGDDYPARIYVTFAYQPQRATFWQKLKRKTATLLYGGTLPGSALNYIWANRLPKGDLIANAYTAQTQMIAVESGDRLAGHWVSETRDLVADYEKAFGYPPPAITGIAIMSDSDNTGGTATAWYGDIRLETTADGDRKGDGAATSSPVAITRQPSR